MAKSKEELTSIFESTCDAISNDGYLDCNGDWHGLDTITTRFYKRALSIKNKNYSPSKTTKIWVENIDTLLAAKKLGPDCAVLNMASFSRPGGGVERGSKAQEEELCRRSNLIRSLYSCDQRRLGLFGDKLIKQAYPIPDFGGIYSKNVTVLRAATSYSYLSDPFSCSVITVPAIKRPDLNSKGEMLEKDLNTLRGKIRTILRIALLGGHRKLVLGAFGCGAYGNNPLQTAESFKSVLEEPEFKNMFSQVCFAVLEDKNSKRNVMGGNIKPFKQVFP